MAIMIEAHPISMSRFKCASFKAPSRPYGRPADMQTVAVTCKKNTTSMSVQHKAKWAAVGKLDLLVSHQMDVVAERHAGSMHLCTGAPFGGERMYRIGAFASCGTVPEQPLYQLLSRYRVF